jgi:hypothetical protein
MVENELFFMTKAKLVTRRAKPTEEYIPVDLGEARESRPVRETPCRYAMKAAIERRWR